ncbi:uncharacterized protein LOC128743700 [Sabethes cyaneus]|uniref:uncharacterized protein LOC128743700 n=1 Tax=Sabethes cyaneus TaxID=53552 RepID=UPI00237ECA90|nr:uncharacterized protein LOC128743700 [Sabethes cyaneus]
MKCAASFCKSKVHRASNGIGFFRFPKDIVTRQKWIDFCRLLPNRQVTANSRLCSLHFNYERDLYVASRGGKLLTIPGAVPTFGNVQNLNAKYEGNERAMVCQRVEENESEGSINYTSMNDDHSYYVERNQRPQLGLDESSVCQLESKLFKKMSEYDAIHICDHQYARPAYSFDDVDDGPKPLAETEPIIKFKTVLLIDPLQDFSENVKCEIKCEPGS